MPDSMHIVILLILQLFFCIVVFYFEIHIEKNSKIKIHWWEAGIVE
jgi:hypothetical protein